MTSADEPRLRFYTDLARWWPLVSPVEEYAGEAEEFARVLLAARPSTRSVLELGCGGGHNAHYLKRSFELTLSDLSEPMLDLSRRLNPECAHLLGDMRSLDLGRTFDAVFVHDAIDYMTTEAELSAALATAYRHCRPGGVALFVPDVLQESFAPSTDCGGSDGAHGEGIRYLEWSYDPDPSDTAGTTHYAFVVRAADGSIESFSETHAFGIFPRTTWITLLAAQGFRAEPVIERTFEERAPRVMFLGHR